MVCPNDYCEGILENHITEYYETSYCTECGFYEKVDHAVPIKMPSSITGYEKRRKKVKKAVNE